VRSLIINADDFGLTAGVNRAIVEAHEHGVVTSTTLMANAPEFDQAVRLAQAAPALSVGCHVVLVDGLPLLGASQVSSLIANPSGNQMRFRESWSSFAVAALRGLLVAGEIEAEATAQIRKLQSAGIALCHLDTHKHTHIFPQVLQPLLRAAKACGVGAVRNPFEAMRLVQLAKRPSLWKRWVGTRTLNGFAEGFRRMVKAAGMLTPDGSVGIVATGALDDRLLAGIVETLPEGTWELVCHPGYDDAQLQNVRTRLRGSRTQELQLLTAREIRDLLVENAVELISYRDLS
jgi:hopanoid biosynthesis associated protein HpnK